MRRDACCVPSTRRLSVLSTVLICYSFFFLFVETQTTKTSFFLKYIQHPTRAEVGNRFLFLFFTVGNTVKLCFYLLSSFHFKSMTEFSFSLTIFLFLKFRIYLCLCLVPDYVRIKFFLRNRL